MNILLSGIFFWLTFSSALAETPPKAVTPPEIQDIFNGAIVTEGGWIETRDGQAKELTQYILSNWRYLISHLEAVPSVGGTTDSAARIIGTAAEDLSPEEYLEFLDAYLSSYSERKISDDSLMFQLFGTNRKNYFICVNSAHPRIQSILKKAKELVPEENDKLHTIIEELAAGKDSDMYFSNASSNALPPETLPGIKLRRPFESMPPIVSDFLDRKESSRQRGKEGQPSSVVPATGTHIFPQQTTKFVTAGLALLLGLAAWQYRSKRRKAVHQNMRWP